MRADLIAYISMICDWQPPVHGRFRLNKDTAVDVKLGRVGYAAAVRNHDGLVMASGIDYGLYLDDIVIVEAEPIHFGI